MSKPGTLHKEVPHETQQQVYDIAGKDQLQKHHKVANQQEQN